MFLTAVLALTLSGCATIIDGGRKTVSVRSKPSDAKVTVYDKKGDEIAVQQTPALLTLKRGGSYSTARYRIVIEKPGYAPCEVEVKSKLNAWYFGNIMFGGLVGLLIVDPLTGAMWTLSPKDVEQVLQSGSTAYGTDKEGLYVVLRQDVPASVEGQLQALQ